MTNTFFIDRRSEDEINEQIKAYVANAVNPPSRTNISVDKSEDKPSYPLAMSLNRVVRFLATKTNLLGEKYFRFITDKAGLFALPPASAVAPVRFALTKGYDQAFVPKGTKLGVESDSQISFQTIEDLIVRNNSIKSVTVEDHLLSHSWRVSADNGDIKDKVSFNDVVNGKNIVYRQTFTIQEKIKKESLQFLQFTNLDLMGVQYSFDTFVKIFRFTINGTEVTPVHFKALFENDEKVKVISGMGVDGDPGLSALNIYVPINVGDAEQIKVEIATKDSTNLKDLGIQYIQFGAVKFFQYSAPTGVVVNESKIVIGADSKHFTLNEGTENLIYLGSADAFSTKDASFKALIETKVYWEGLNRVSRIFRTQAIDDSLLANFSKFFKISKLEYFDGVFWTPIPGVNPDNIKPSYNSTTKILSWNLEFTVPTIETSKISGMEARWIRMAFTNTSESLGDSIFGDNSEYYQSIYPWVRITNILLKKVVGDSSLTKLYQIGDFPLPDNINLQKPLEILPARTDIFFELETICENHILDWYFFVDPQNREQVPQPSSLQLEWSQRSSNQWLSNIRVLEDRTVALTKSGRIVLDIGSGSYLNPETNTFMLKLRVSPTTKETEALVINGIYNNTVEVEGVETDSEPRYFSGTAEENQTLNLGITNILDLVLMIKEPLVQGEESGLHLATNTKIFDWKRVENFYDSGPRDRHYFLDYSLGQIKFGDGIKGKSPPKGNKNIAVTNLRKLSSGVDGVEAGEITKLAKKIPGIKECQNIYRATGYRLASSEESFYAIAPQKFKHSNRPVTFSDFEQIVLEAFSEVYSCKAFLEIKGDNVKVKVIVVPRNVDDLHTNDSLLSKIDDYLVNHCVTSKIKTCYPDLVPISFKITTKGLDDSDGTIATAVKSRLSEFFDTVKGGQDRQGWQVGRNVYKSEISWALNDILGSHLYKVEFPSQTVVHNSYIALGPNEYPDISDVTVVGEA